MSKKNGFVGFWGFSDEYTSFKRKYYFTDNRKRKKNNTHYLKDISTDNNKICCGDTIVCVADDNPKKYEYYYIRSNNKLIGKEVPYNYTYNNRGYIIVDLIKNSKYFCGYGDTIILKNIKDYRKMKIELDKNVNDNQDLINKIIRNKIGSVIKYNEEKYKIVRIISKEEKKNESN